MLREVGGVVVLCPVWSGFGGFFVGFLSDGGGRVVVGWSAWWCRVERGCVRAIEAMNGVTWSAGR